MGSRTPGLAGCRLLTSGRCFEKEHLRWPSRHAVRYQWDKSWKTPKGRCSSAERTQSHCLESLPNYSGANISQSSVIFFFFFLIVGPFPFLRPSDVLEQKTTQMIRSASLSCHLRAPWLGPVPETRYHSLIFSDRKRKSSGLFWGLNEIDSWDAPVSY